MDEKLIIQLLKTRGAKSANHFSELKKTVDDHPYFIAGRLLLLKSLQEKESLGYDPELKRTAAHIPSRRKLFEWVSKPLAESDSLLVSEPVPEEDGNKASTIDSEIADSEETATQPEPAKSNEEKPISSAPSKEEGYNPIIPDHVNDPAAEARLRVQKILEARRKKQSPAKTEPTSEPAIVESSKPKQEERPAPAAEIPLAIEKNPEEILAQKEKDTKEEKKPISLLQFEVPEKTELEEEHTKASIKATIEEQIPEDVSRRQENREESNITSEESPKIEFVPSEIENSNESKESAKEDGPTYSFGEWLNVLSAKKAESQRKKKDSLVERFLKDPPNFRPKKEKLSTDSKNIASESLQENPEIMTETLALLYIEQGHFDKAVQAYEILGLRFPEKSSFFAGRIRDLKKRIKDKK